MIQKEHSSDDGPYVASFVKSQLNNAKDIVLKHDQDRFYIVDGREGLGKSTLAMQLGYYIDPNINLDNVVFTIKDFKDRIRDLPKGSVLIWDEAFKGLSSKGSLSKENRKIVTLLQECRQRNLFVFIVLPTIFLLEKYSAIFRSNALFHVAASRKNIAQRYYKIYNYTQKKLLYIHGKTLMSYSKPKVTKAFRFYGRLPPSISKEQYIEKKLHAFRDFGEETKADSKPMRQRDELWHYLNKELNMSMENIGKLHNPPVSKQLISARLAKLPP